MRRLIETFTIAAGLVAAAMGAFAAEPTPGRFAVVHGWPQLPEGRALGSATGVDLNGRGEVHVFHRANRVWSDPFPTDPIAQSTIEVFDAESGRHLRSWGANLFVMPHGLSIDAEENVWVTDVALHQVFKFDRSGRLLLTVGERGVPGAEGGRFNRPTDVAVLPDGSFLVSDGYRNTRVARFDREGRFVTQWGAPGQGPGQFDVPHAIKIGPDGRVYVADRENDRVQVFEPDGRFVAQWKDPRIGRPYSLALLADGAVLTDGGHQPKSGPERSGVAIVDHDGKVVERFGRWGNYDGQFQMAHDAAVGPDGALYVVDVQGRRVQKFVRALPSRP